MKVADSWWQQAVMFIAWPFITTMILLFVLFVCLVMWVAVLLGVEFET